MIGKTVSHYKILEKLGGILLQGTKTRLKSHKWKDVERRIRECCRLE